MQELIEQERFEVEVLARLNSRRLLDPLILGGGTMLRLCHGLNRYSVDIDFWFKKGTRHAAYFKKLKQLLGGFYQVTDAHEKYFTMLFEFRSTKYPRRMKIEIRKVKEEFQYQPMIAFSKYSNVQVSLQALTLDQMMRNKIGALLSRGEIRDCFDIEFMIRRGVKLQASRKELQEIQKKIESFKKLDFSVKLAALLESTDRQYYNQNGFQYLNGHIQSLLA